MPGFSIAPADWLNLNIHMWLTESLFHHVVRREASVSVREFYPPPIPQINHEFYPEAYENRFANMAYYIIFVQSGRKNSQTKRLNIRKIGNHLSIP